MQSDEGDSKQRLLDRRTYLKATGLTALAGITAETGGATGGTESLLVDADGTVAYSFDVNGTVDPVATDADVDDSVDRGSVTGEVTDGLAAYRLTGTLDTVAVDGRARLAYGPAAGDDLPDSPTELLVTSPSKVNYEFTATGRVEPQQVDSNEDSRRVTSNDDGTWTAAGTTGDGLVDSYEVHGGITSFSPSTGDFSVLVDGTPVSTYELTETEPPGHSQAQVGGDGYDDTVDPSAATVTATTVEKLTSALNAASRGDIVYVPGNAELDLGTTTLWIPAGVTLASDRGIDGAPGGLLQTSEATWPMAVVEADARVTGLRFGGSQTTFVQHDTDTLSVGLDVVGSGVEIDNCDIFGFTYAAVHCGADTHVHHSRIHHNPMSGLGYAVCCRDGHPRIEYNYLNYNGHGVTATGTGGYTAAHNHFGPDTLGHVIDAQRPGETGVEIHHNTVEATTRVQDTTTPESVVVRGAPEDTVTLRDNWFYNDNAPKATPDGRDGSAITQLHTESWDNVEFSNNHYGTDEPRATVGHPR
ncbi:MAG: hypothetical protein V5A45_06770 [Haloarculaceae archaeon]